MMIEGYRDECSFGRSERDPNGDRSDRTDGIETDRIAGGAPTGDPGNAYGAGRGWGMMVLAVLAVAMAGVGRKATTTVAPRHNRLDTGLGRDNTGHLSCCPGSAEGGGVVPPFPFQRIEGERHRQAERKSPGRARVGRGFPGGSGGVVNPRPTHRRR